MNWTEALELSKKDQRVFIERGRKVVKRYRDERPGNRDTDTGKRYNILWSNVKTIFPAVYAKKPRAQVERRYKDKDPVARCASEILERCLQYEIDHYSDYDAALKGAVLDRLLPGRGVAWIRFEGGDQITDDVQDGDEAEASVVPLAPAPLPGLSGAAATPAYEGEHECTPSDYVYWEDFRHSPARTWEEVTWVARRVYMGKEELKKRFPEAGEIPMVHEPIGLDKDITATDDMKKAVVWEIWNKPTRDVIWRADGHPTDLDKVADPLDLDGFFPCPKPLFATMTSDTLIPVADYLEYQDQAIEMDDLTTRIGLLVKAVKVVGVYDASQTGIQRMLNEGVDNTLIPVDNWAPLAEKGGIKGTVDFLPLDMVVAALNELYKARDICKQVIFDVTGLSDIIRGSSDPNETATAQGIKSQFGSMRLKEIQGDVARFATDILNIKAQIMSDLYRPETLIMMSGIDKTDDAPLAEQAIQLLKSESMRNYRIEIATDSMVEIDEQAEKAGRVEFLTAAGGFLKQAVEAAQMAPELAPLMGEMLMFGVRAFKAGRPLEAAFEQFVAKANEPKAPRPIPEQIKMQGLMQIEQGKAQVAIQTKQAELQANMQTEQAKLQATAQIEQMKAQFAVQTAEAQRAHDAQLEQAKMQMQAQVDNNRQRAEAEQHSLKINQEAQLAQLKMQQDDAVHQREMDFQRWKTEFEMATKIEVANITSKAKVEDSATKASTAEVTRELPPAPDFTPLTAAAEKLASAAELMSKPKKRTIVRGKDGKATGMIEE